MTLLTILLLSFLPLKAPTPPDSISLRYCQRLASQNYPTAGNIKLQQKITDLNVRIARSGYFPQVTVNGKATYQSEVTSFGLPGGQGPPPVSKDQYTASLHAVETIFNAGKVGIQKALQQVMGAKKQASTRVKMHQIRMQVNQVYYGILLSGQQAKTINLKIKNLQGQLSVVRSKVENGVLLASQQYILEAELAKSRKDSAITSSNIKAGYDVLSELVGKELQPTVKLSLPEGPASYRSLQPGRPEYQVFKNSKKVLQQQQKLSKTRILPRVSAFGTGSYGRPGLNFINNDFHYYYIVGVQFNWSLWGALNGGRKAQALKIQQQRVEQNRKAFTRQLHAQLDRISRSIAALRENIKRDRTIVAVRQKIVEQSASQLKNGVITATDYVTQLRRANQAKLSLYISRVQLSQAQTNYATAMGIPIQPK